MANMRLVKLKNRPSKGVFVFEYMQEQIERLRGQGKERTVETYQSALNSFMKFRDGIDLCFDEMDADLMEHYETEMRSTHHLSRNTTSFYMRILRCVYRKAVGEGLALPADPFENVYTGVDKTSKRAATLTDIKHIKQLDLSDHKSLEFARDIFLFSFYMRGMSFIDLAYLRKKDLNSGFVSYSRRKTGKKLIIRWEKQMQEIIDRYGDSETQKKVSKTAQKIIDLVISDPSITADNMANKIGVTKRAIEKNIKSLRGMGILVHEGSDKAGYWRIIVKP